MTGESLLTGEVPGHSTHMYWQFLRRRLSTVTRIHAAGFVLGSVTPKHGQLSFVTYRPGTKAGK